ncbi:hypothetical protein F4680DRAFT_465520 [Xylaria scruposa]|nr:hypothetical protein F4680DRAFT_465520 [Xylaria scruposa]
MEFPTNLRVEFKEGTPGSFSVGTENVPSTTPESASLHIQQPYTPLSSRTTPTFHSMPMKTNQPGYGTSGLFGLTTPESTYGGFVPEPHKPDSGHYLQVTDPRYLSKYPPLDPTLPSPLDLPQVSYYPNNSTYDFSSLEWPADGPSRYFTRQDVPLNEVSLHNNTLPPLPSPYLYQARPSVEEVRQKSEALQRVQQRHIAKRKARASQNALNRPVAVIEAGLHVCRLGGCEGNRGFKRHEHLKRHINTVHFKLAEHRCAFCWFFGCGTKPFNRFDNFRQHVGLHCKKDGSGRTRFHHLAPRFHALLEALIKPRNKKKRAQRNQAGPTPILDQATIALQLRQVLEELFQGQMVDPALLALMLPTILA